MIRPLERDNINIVISYGTIYVWDIVCCGIFFFFIFVFCVLFFYIAINNSRSRSESFKIVKCSIFCIFVLLFSVCTGSLRQWWPTLFLQICLPAGFISNQNLNTPVLIDQELLKATIIDGQVATIMVGVKVYMKVDLQGWWPLPYRVMVIVRENMRWKENLYFNAFAIAHTTFVPHTNILRPLVKPVYTLLDLLWSASVKKNLKAF